MPIISKYSNDEINNLVEQLLDVIDNNKVSVDLALIALGNTVSNVIDSNVKPEVKKQIANSFAEALLNSLSAPKH
jgi:uncharacterized protein